VAERRRCDRPDRILVRLVTSFQTTKDDVDRFLAIVRAHISAPKLRLIH
jgi:threonine aldolase